MDTDAVNRLHSFSEPPFDKYRRNVYSQNGEDGVIEELLGRIGVCLGRGRTWAFESGAWDGKHLSNTYNLATKHGFTVVAVEGHPDRFTELVDTATELMGTGRGKIVPVNEWLGETTDTVGGILRRHGAPDDLALMSIDIDGFDYHVWENLSDDFRPAIVVIDIDSSVPPGVAGVHGDMIDGTPRGGTTFTSMLELGTRKGYVLVAHTGNCIFVRRDLVDRLGVSGINFVDPTRLFRWNLDHADEPSGSGYIGATNTSPPHT